MLNICLKIVIFVITFFLILGFFKENRRAGSFEQYHQNQSVVCRCKRLVYIPNMSLGAFGILGRLFYLSGENPVSLESLYHSNADSRAVIDEYINELVDNQILSKLDDDYFIDLSKLEVRK